jgi:BON domain
MKMSTMILLLAPVTFCAGCAQSQPAPATAYYRPADAYLTPTSDRPAPRVYPGPSTPAWLGTPPSAPPPGVNQMDLAVADQISQTLHTDPLLASISQNVQVTVRKGVVTLDGRVPTEHAKDEISLRLAQIPGVDRIDNDLAVNIR